MCIRDSDVHAGMDSIASIRVQAPGGPEHGPISSGLARVGMGGGIAAIAQIGFDLDQAQDQAVARRETPNQSTPDQIGGHDARIAGIEALAEWFSEGHVSSIGKSSDRAPPAASSNP